MMRTSKYILTADDYGAVNFIDEGIRKAIQAGKINSVACFAVPMGPKDDLYERMEKLLALKRHHDFAIGLHFSLTAGRSNDINVSKFGNSLTRREMKDGHYYMRDPKNFKFRAIDPQELAIELNSQLTRLRQYTTEIDSISNHHGIVYMDTDLFKPYAETAAAHGIPVRSPVVWKKYKLPTGNFDHRIGKPVIRQGLKLRWVDQLLDAAKNQPRLDIAKQLKLVYPTCLVDEIYGQPYPENLELLFSAYYQKVFAAEFMFHLGDPDFTGDKTAPDGIDAGYFDTRKIEYQSLLGATLPDTHAQRVQFKDLVPDDLLPPINIII